MRVVIVRAGRAIRTVVAIGRGAVIVMMITAALVAFLGLRLAVGMVHREHATAKPGDHAEHQQPCKPTAHAA